MSNKCIVRVCAKCEWIFKETNKIKSCPQCGFAHYAAKYVYGNKAYKYLNTQKPWKQKKLTQYEIELDLYIMNINKE